MTFHFVRRMSMVFKSRSSGNTCGSSRSGAYISKRIPRPIPALTLISSQAERQRVERADIPTAPPPYTLAPSTTLRAENKAPDSPYSFLGEFDTIFLIDDSGSMEGSSWREVAAVLETIAPICTGWDTDGIDIHFLNRQDNERFSNITSAAAVQQIFREVSPHGATPIGKRLDAIMSPYIQSIRKRGGTIEVGFPKPMNIIVITDGVPTDDPESIIVRAARQLDDLDAPSWQIGIQFFQVGAEKAARSALIDLDDNLKSRHFIRDMVDTVAWRDGQRLDGEFILKCVLGAVNQRLDRKSIN